MDFDIYSKRITRYNGHYGPAHGTENRLRLVPKSSRMNTVNRQTKHSISSTRWIDDPSLPTEATGGQWERLMSSSEPPTADMMMVMIDEQHRLSDALERCINPHLLLLYS